MATELRLPQLAEGDATGTVVRVLVAPGDEVAPGQGVVEVETEKAVVEVPSDLAGRVREVHVSEGDEVASGALLLTLEEAEGQADGGDGASAPAQGSPARGASAPAGATADREEDRRRDERGDARSPDERAEDGGATRGEPEPQPAPGPAPAAAPRVPLPQPSGSEARGPRPLADSATDRADIAAAPSVRRFARELGIDIAAVRGTGPGGRISDEDVKAYSRERFRAGTGLAPADGVPAEMLARAPLPDLSRWGEVTREPMSGVRRATAQNLSRSWPAVPQVTQHDEADVTDVEAFRKRYGKRVEEAGGKLTVTAILVKVAAAALKAFPRFRAAIDVERGELVLRQYFHIGVAVDTEHGLLVPVIRDVDRKSLVEVAKELKDISERARQRKLSLDEMQGGTFTISNLGGIGGTSFTPIVNAPEVAILGVSRTRTEPRWDGERFVPRQILPLSLSYDHRVIDGADAARFLRWIAEALEQPLLLALEG